MAGGGGVHRAQDMMWRRISSGSVSSWVGRAVAAVSDSDACWVSSGLVTMAVRLGCRVGGSGRMGIQMS